MRITTLMYTPKQGFSIPLPANDTPTLLVLVFGSSAFLENTYPFEILRTHYPQAIFMGCSSAGEILGQHIYDNSLAIALVEFAQTTLRIAYSAITDTQASREVGRSLAKQLTGTGLKSLFVLSDGLRINGSELAHGLNEVIPTGTVVTGGLAADGERFQQTWVLQDGKPTVGIVAALGFYGDIHVSHGSKGGWRAFGPAREVTRAENNVLYELSGKPALALYKTYLGEMASGLPATGLRFPLALRKPGGDEDKELVRTILAIDEAQQSLTFAGDIPVGAFAQLMHANIEQLVEGAEDAAIMSAIDTVNPVLCIAISCVGRRMVMGVDASEEVEAVLDQLPPQTTQIGFYSYGELSPFSKGACDLHNQTMTLTTFYE